MSLNLSLSGKRWVYQPVNVAEITVLQNELGVSRLVAELLVRRGYSDPSSAHRFLNPSLDDLGDPFLLPDYAYARDAILGAKERGERIFIHGDYDVDGVTSAAILDRYLKRIGCDVHTHVPHRMNEGYGINLSAVAEAQRLGTKLFLTCDCGIAAHTQVEEARSLGMTVVVTDHHELKETLPNAEAIVNPHRTDSKYPFSNLSGAGVVFRLCEGLTRELDPQGVASYRKNFLDLACLGTIADVMPLTNDNRIIAKFGLERLSETKKKGLVALKEVSEIAGRVSTYDVGFKLGPRLNAAGRVDDAALSLKLLLTESQDEADSLAKELNELNMERRMMQEQMVEQAIAQASQLDIANTYTLLIFSDQWHPGIVGIAAGKLKEQFNRPTFVGTIDPETGKGKASGRSIPSFNLAELINNNTNLVSGGGHAMAAGIAFDAKNLEAIREAFDAYAKTVMTPEDLLPAIDVSALVSADEVTQEFVSELQKFEPFGMANPKPIFVANGVKVTSVRPMGPLQTHAQLQLEGGTRAVSFGNFEIARQLTVGEAADLLFEPNLNEFRGETTLQWKVQDFRISQKAGVQL